MTTKKKINKKKVFPDRKPPKTTRSRENKPNFTAAELKIQAGLVLSLLDSLGQMGTATVIQSKAAQ